MPGPATHEAMGGPTVPQVHKTRQKDLAEFAVHIRRAMNGLKPDEKLARGSQHEENVPCLFIKREGQ